MLGEKDQLESDLRFVQKQLEEFNKNNNNNSYSQRENREFKGREITNTTAHSRNYSESSSASSHIKQIEELTQKHLRAKQVSDMFEQKYQDSQKELEICRAQISQNFKQLQTKDDEIELKQRLKEEAVEKIHRMELNFE